MDWESSILATSLLLLHSFRTVWIIFNNVTFLIRITKLMKSYQQIFIDSLKSGLSGTINKTMYFFILIPLKANSFYKTIYSLCVRSGCNIILKCKHVMLLLKQITNLHMRRYCSCFLHTHTNFFILAGFTLNVFVEKYTSIGNK